VGKRSDFERIPHDLYPTPAEAVQPLIPFLRTAGVRTFAEPCCGNGELARHLEGYGLTCAYRGDIATGRDALTLTSGDCNKADCITTNPPYDTTHRRQLMHAMILHFQHIAPTWLLVDADWAHTKQAAPFLHSCSDIVAIGRVKWIQGSKHAGKDNHAWYRFDTRHKSGPKFHGRDQSEIIPSWRAKVCEQCGKHYEPRRSSSHFCSGKCRQHAHRKRLSVTTNVTPAPNITKLSDCSEEFRYVLHAEVPRMAAEGWERLPALDGTHHGEYSALMRRVEHGAATSTLEPIADAPNNRGAA
jgi:hypothetical protein